MGGHAFKTTTGMPLSSRIMRDEILPTLNDFFSKVLPVIPIGTISILGSAGKKSVSNDIDICVSPACADADSKTFKTDLLLALKSIMGNEHAKLVGQAISVNHPIVSPDPVRHGLRVQIDLMVSRDPASTAWLMSGTGENEVKGVYRNLLLSYVAKLRSTAGRKITISYPGGVQAEEGGIVVTPRNENPKEAFKVLGILGDPETLSEFESLLDALLEQGFDLSGFEEYLAGSLKRDPPQAQRALDVLRSRLCQTKNDHQSARALPCRKR